MATEKLGVATDVRFVYGDNCSNLVLCQVVIEGELSESERRALRLTCVDSHLHFVAMELLKNAMQASAAKFGTLSEHPPISLRLSLLRDSGENFSEPAPPFALDAWQSPTAQSQSTTAPAPAKQSQSQQSNTRTKLLLSVSDRGGGIPRELADRVFDYSFTTAEAFAEQSGYTYSRRFGAPFTGSSVASQLFSRL